MNRHDIAYRKTAAQTPKQPTSLLGANSARHSLRSAAVRAPPRPGAPREETPPPPANAPPRHSLRSAAVRAPSRPGAQVKMLPATTATESTVERRPSQPSERPRPDPKSVALPK